MADFSLADAIADDVPGQAGKTGTNPSASSSNPPPANPGWPTPAPGAPDQPSGQGQVPGGPSVPGAPGQYPGPPSLPSGFPPGPGVPGQYPSGAGAPGQFPGQIPGQYPGQYPGQHPGQHPGQLPGQFPGQFPGQYPPEGAPGQLPGGPMPYPSGPFHSGPGAPPGPYPNVPFPGGLPGGMDGMYGPGGPGAFPPAAGPGAFPAFPGGAFPPVPPGSWGPPASGGFPPAPGPFGPGHMGPCEPAAPAGVLTVPYDLPLHAGIMPRLLITIVGEPVPGGDRFHVDFIKGPDVVFHFNPRFHEQTVVRNSNLDGCWGPEEREGGFPFVQGRRFELKILVEEDMFKVAVDDAHLLEFEHRVGGLEEVTLLRVVGDVTIYSAAPSMI